MTQPDGHGPQRSSGSFALATRLSGGLEVSAVHRTTGQVQSHSVGQSYAVLGRAPQASIRLDDPSVSQCHAYLQLVDGVPYCIDLGSRTGVLWDDGGRGRGWIHPGQTVRIGIFDVQIIGTGDASHAAPGEFERLEPGASDAPQMVTLDVHSPTGPSGRFTLELPVTLIGRHPACSLRFLDEGTAYFQGTIVKTRGGIWCVDILSRTGTVVNGRPVRIAQLRDGDLIELGNVSLVLRVGPSMPPPLAVFGPSGIRSAPSAAPDAVRAVLIPLGEMMEQFQQCFLTMSRMFTTMQQEHTAMMCEQMRQIQELLRETRPAQLPPPAAPVPAVSPQPPPTTPPTPAAKAPIPRPVDPEDASLLEDAHTWFLDRLHQNGAASKPNPN